MKNPSDRTCLRETIPSSSDKDGERTIRDFGDQWRRFTDNEGYYGSDDLFKDILHPFLTPEDIKGRRVGEIGSGTGRIIHMLLRAGASHAIALEPSMDAFRVLQRNLSDTEKVTFLQTTGDRLPPYGDLDYLFSIGVLHHIPEPETVVKAAFNALRPGGRFLVWLYGKEGNEIYLKIIYPLRTLTRRLPHFLLHGMVWLIYLFMVVYKKLLEIFPLPLKEYVSHVYGKMSPEKQRLVIYDQLNPAFARHYSRQEAFRLMDGGGFTDVDIHHRHGYSWTLIGKKPL